MNMNTKCDKLNLYGSLEFGMNYCMEIVRILGLYRICGEL